MIQGDERVQPFGPDAAVVSMAMARQNRRVKRRLGILDRVHRDLPAFGPVRVTPKPHRGCESGRGESVGPRETAG
ncbi:MAG TPA: hypothetical protein VFY72_01800, partial [Beijerinckiaceae bacterium]|nr:hypothetical protein [Beijerinckiaceae bacterium]